ncbi:MAG: site-specific DNA-methyltransferase, partial [Thaumarchaeota archaeon]|nr:site-specific DNA-methyltransferase [Nitrososphaerota archaeon]
GSGTTSKVCALLGRNSVGYELNQSLKDRIYIKINAAGRVKLRSEKRHDSVPEFEMEEVPSGRRPPRQSLR